MYTILPMNPHCVEYVIFLRFDFLPARRIFIGCSFHWKKWKTYRFTLL